MPEALKNMYNPAFIGALSSAISGAYPAFKAENFQASVFDAAWESRELKDRMRHITRCLRPALPDDYPAAVATLRQAAISTPLQGYSFELMIFPDFVELYGLDDWDNSLPALEQFTQLCSAEFAVRPFILRDSARMMGQMYQWAQHDNHHVRRLASEGCRPRLPWAMALPAFKADPTPILPILDALKNDESEYVRRSVANNLNDIAKDNPQVVIDTLHGWKHHDTAEMRWMLNHALRTLVKAGNREALGLLGYQEVTLEVHDLTITPSQIDMQGEISFSFTLLSTSPQAQSVMVDYAVHFARANGKTGHKVFKLAKKDLQPGEKLTLSKKHSFRPITTRRYYPGQHAIEIQINGAILARGEFTLRETMTHKLS